MTDAPGRPRRIDLHAHHLAPRYREALQEAEIWLAQLVHLSGAQGLLRQ